MKEKFVNSITKFITKNKYCDEKKVKIIRYGLSGLYSLITKLIVVTILTVILNSFLEFIALLLAYLLLRRYSFGLHSPKGWICWVSTILIYVGGSLLIKYYDFNIYIIYVNWLFAFLSFILWAPADTPKRPLIRAKQRKIQKLKTCFITIIYLFVILYVKNNLIIDAITLSLLIQAIMVNPIIYWITKTPFNNYKLYPNKV